MAEYKVLITTSGIGSRLGDLTKYTNKSLIRIGKKPAISYIIESYSEDIEFVITLGYYGEHVSQFLPLAYPNRKFTFIVVDNYNRTGSSLGYSMLKAKNELNCPFIFHASDTIITDKEIKEPTKNWIGYCQKLDCSQYRTISFGSNDGFTINEKGNFDTNFAYIGLAGIKDYDIFWDTLEREYNKNKNDNSLSDCSAINNMQSKWDLIEYKNWVDVGNSFELKKARETIYDKFDLLDKVDESLFIFNGFVIKFFYNKEICNNRVLRCVNLKGVTPNMIAHSENFYKYEYVNGQLLSKVINETIFNKLLIWCNEKLWIKEKGTDDFYKKCENFYFQKTFSRLDNLFSLHNITDNKTLINGIMVPPAIDLINKIDKKWLCSAESYQFHGDLILDNIIYKENEEFTLIDWRQDFGGDIKNGDIYYDLAKLNHNLLFNHDIIYKNLYSVEKINNEIRCDILRSDILTNCRSNYHEWLVKNNFDKDKVEILTSIIWLNMASLHEYKIGEFLYYFGRYNLYKAVKKHEQRT